MTNGADISAIPADLLADAVEALEEGIAIYDADERLVTFNRRYRETLGPVGATIEPGMHWRDFPAGETTVSPSSEDSDSDTAWAKTLDRLKRTGAKHTVIRLLGDRYIEASYHPTRSGGFVVTRTDVTDRHVAEERAKERERLLTAILETNPIPVVMAQVADGKIVYRSPAAEEMLSGATDARRAYFDGDARQEYIRLLKKHGKVDNFPVKRQFLDGSVQNMALSGALTEYGGETCVVSSISNLTEIRRREAMIGKLVEACPAPVLMARAETGEIIYRSPKADELYGPGENAAAFWANPADREPYMEALREKGEIIDWRARFRKADGSHFECALSARMIEWASEAVIVSCGRDLTDELALAEELDQQRQQGFQNEKMLALGGLMAGVAHELNNPLSVVVGHAMMLEEETEDSDLLRQVQKISAAAERCAKIVKAFLTMAREEPIRLEQTDLNEVIETAVEVARYGDTLGSVAVEMQLDPNLVKVSGDGDQITQVVINLILNAAQAMRLGDGRVTITSANTPKGPRIGVEDTGPGVPKEIAARVFEPFFTTKGVGQGTGIGLAMCHRIVGAHGGTIKLEAAEGGGARFVVTLPPAPCGEPEETTASEALQPKAARVLVIDDEADVAELNAEILARAGFAPIVVTKAIEVMDSLLSHQFDAVLSDLNMPDIDGRGVYAAIAEHQPELIARTGFLTGDTMGQQSQTFLGEVKRPYLEKPVSPLELRAFVGRLVTGENT